MAGDDVRHDSMIESIRRAGEVAPPPGRDGAMAHAMNAVRPASVAARIVPRTLVAAVAAAMLIAPVAILSGRGAPDDTAVITSTSPTPSEQAVETEEPRPARPVSEAPKEADHGDDDFGEGPQDEPEDGEEAEPREDEAEDEGEGDETESDDEESDDEEVSGDEDSGEESSDGESEDSGSDGESEDSEDSGESGDD